VSSRNISKRRSGIGRSSGGGGGVGCDGSKQQQLILYVNISHVPF
jgi:hypothetical protein